MKIAIIGSGVSGLGAAWALSRKYPVTLFEAADTLGGHAHTVDIEVDGRRVPVDTGFIVYNELNYPALSRLFAALGVETERSNMSFAVSLDDRAREYTGTLKGLLSHPGNLASGRHWRMIFDILRFYRNAEALAARPDLRGLSLGEFLGRTGFSDVLATDHLMPMAAAIWSSTQSQTIEFPAETFIRFFANHGLFNLKTRPQWRTVRGGSRNYVTRIAQKLTGRLRLATPVVAVDRRGPGVTVVTEDGHKEHFDQAVLATHADQALKIIGPDATPDERCVLGGIQCQDNIAYLHSDPRLMPRRRDIWASWNYLAAPGDAMDRPVSVSYWMNELQNIDTPSPVVVSLNPLSAPDPDKTHLKYSCRHPQFDRRALAAQAGIRHIQGTGGLWYCGAWMGYGFHEDGLEAGLSVAAALGAPAPWQDEIVHKSPASANARPSAPLAMAAE